MDSQTRSFDSIGGRHGPLRYRVGMVYPIDYLEQVPENVEGVIVLPPTPDAKVAKFYLPPVEEDLAKTKQAEYPVPPSVQNAPRGELLLKKRPQCTVRFGRPGEDTWFAFEDGKHYLPLQIRRVGEGGFVPLFIEVQKNNVYFYLRLEVRWEGNFVKVTLAEIEEDDLPMCLLLPDPAAMR